MRNPWLQRRAARFLDMLRRAPLIYILDAYGIDAVRIALYVRQHEQRKETKTETDR